MTLPNAPVDPLFAPYQAQLPLDDEGAPRLGQDQRLRALPTDPDLPWESWAPWANRWHNPETTPEARGSAPTALPARNRPRELYDRLSDAHRPTPEELNEALRQAVQPFNSHPSTTTLMRQELSVALLLARGATCSDTTLARATLCGNPRLLHRLLVHRGHPVWPEVPDTFNDSPLLVLAAQDHAWATDAVRVMVRQLVDAGISPNVRDRAQDRPALHWATANHCAPVVRALLEAGADVHATNPNGHTAAHYAAARNDVASLQALLDHGADLQVHTPQVVVPPGATPSTGRVRLGFETDALARALPDDERSTWVAPSVVRPPRPPRARPAPTPWRPTGAFGLGLYAADPAPPSLPVPSVQVYPPDRAWRDTPLLQAAYAGADEAIAWLMAQGVDPCPPLNPAVPDGPRDERALALLEGAWRRAQADGREEDQTRAEQGRTLVERALLRIPQAPSDDPAATGKRLRSRL